MYTQPIDQSDIAKRMTPSPPMSLSDAADSVTGASEITVQYTHTQKATWVALRKPVFRLARMRTINESVRRE